jgi:hypothetical protein
VGIAASACTDLFDARQGVDLFEDSVRVGIEALILHTWYCDLWDVRSDDTDNWDTKTFRNIMLVVTTDRKVVKQRMGDNLASGGSILVSYDIYMSALIISSK